LWNEEVRNEGFKETRQEGRQQEEVSGIHAKGQGHGKGRAPDFFRATIFSGQ
jgi:hypothetical protein